MNVSLFKDLYKSKDVPYIVSLETCLNRIKIGKSKDKIEAIRKGDASLKHKLPCILFSGEFSQRSKKGLVKHSGLMVLDFDKFKAKKDMIGFRDTIIDNPYIVTVFISPSGNGLKAVVKIPECDAINHERYFKAFQEQFNYPNFDSSNCNVDRVCFESYDPKIYINLDAEVFSPQLEDKGFNVRDKEPVLILSDESKKADIIMSWNWAKGFYKGQRNNFILDIASAFCEYGVSREYALNYIANNVAIFDNDFTEREMESTINSAYKLRQFGIKYFEDYSKIKAVQKDLKHGKEYIINKHKIDEQTFDELKKETSIEDFWYFDKKGKVQIDVVKYKLFLENEGGYRKYFPHDTNKPTWVKIKSNIVEETSPEKIKDFVLNKLFERDEMEVWSYCAKFGNLFSDQFLLMLDTIELLLLRDTRTNVFLAFQNGILEITKDDFKLHDYVDVDGYIWKRQIIPRNWKQVSITSNEYETFVINIARGQVLPFECAIGYLISTHKNKMNNKAIILNDETISENPEGGTGKGLFVQGLRQMRNVSILDGKTFDDKKSFPYQTVSQETQILVFDDVKKNFDFENKFSLVTEGITLERKNKDAIKLTVETSPKMLISTNYAIRGEGNSHDRRRHELEVSQYYGSHLTPFDEFGRQLFDDWNDDDYVRFDNYMVQCVQMYLINGLIAQTSKNLELRKFISGTSQEFYEFMENENNFRINERFNKVTLFNEFCSEYEDFKRWLTQRKFTAWCEKYARYKNLKYTDGRTINDRWFEITS